MAIQKPEWFKMDPAKFFSDAQVDAMSTLELGACFRLLGRQWIDGYIPDESRLLARLCRLDDASMREAWVTLSAFFPVVEPGKRANRFMWIEREKVVADLERRSDEGTRAANKRWNARKRDAESTATPIADPNGSPMPEPMQDQTRADQTRADNHDATGMQHPLGDKVKTSKREIEAESNPSMFNSTEIAQILCQKTGWSGQHMIWALQAAIDFQAKRMPEVELEQVGEALVTAFARYKSEKGNFAVCPQKFFEQGLYCPTSDRREAKNSVLTDNPATRALAQMEAS
jgi:uncharacterized protein YdaU (DUF1376 family)